MLAVSMAAVAGPLWILQPCSCHAGVYQKCTCSTLGYDPQGVRLHAACTPMQRGVGSQPRIMSTTLRSSGQQSSVGDWVQNQLKGYITGRLIRQF